MTLNYQTSAAMGFFQGTQERKVETAMLNKPSVFEPLKFYCIWKDRSELTVQAEIRLLLKGAV